MDAGDRANDSIRINGGDLRAKVIGEGANLGCTQLGRVEYAFSGGRINTDAIDNSAGVDTSDHEVNLKILFSGPMRRGEITGEERDKFLTAMTDDVADHVLQDNYDQTLTRCPWRKRAPTRISTRMGGSCAIWKRAESSTARWSSFQTMRSFACVHKATRD